RAIAGTSSATRSFAVVSSAPDPSCSQAPNDIELQCQDNPCNPTSIHYQPSEPGCGSFTPPDTVSSPITEPSTTSTPSGSRSPPAAKHPPAGPVPGSTLSRAL